MLFIIVNNVNIRNWFLSLFSLISFQFSSASHPLFNRKAVQMVAGEFLGPHSHHYMTYKIPADEVGFKLFGTVCLFVRLPVSRNTPKNAKPKYHETF